MFLTAGAPLVLSSVNHAPFFWHFMLHYQQQSHFVYTCFYTSVSLANLYAHANFCIHNYVNRIYPGRGRVREGGGGWNQIKSCSKSIVSCLAGRIWQRGLTGGVVSDAIEHLRTGSCHHLAGAAPGPAGADAINGSVTGESRAWSVRTEVSRHRRTFLAWLWTTFSCGETLTMILAINLGAK